MKEWMKVLSEREGLSEDEIHLLTDNQERRSFAKNEIVFHKDETNSNVYIITKASGGLTTSRTATKPPHGLPRRVNWCFPFGAILPTRPHACRSNR